MEKKSIRFLFEQSNNFSYNPPVDDIGVSEIFKDAFVIDFRDCIKDEGSEENWDCCKDNKE